MDLSDRESDIATPVSNGQPRRRQSRSPRAKRALGSQSPAAERVGAYVRVSLDKRTHKSGGRAMAEEIVSPDTQERKARSYCDAQGWDLAMIEHDIDESAYRQHYSKREGLMRLLAAADRGEISKIIVFKFNRLSRRLQEFVEICDRLEARGGGVVSISEQYDTSTPSGRMVRNIMASFAQYQSEELSEQIFETWLTKAKQGLRPPGRPPYGTVLKRGLLVPHGETYDHLLAMYRTFVETGSFAAVVDYLDERRIPAAHGGNWSLTAVRRILTNPAYVSQIEFAGDVFDGKWEPIVPPDLWAQVQEIVAGRQESPPPRVDAHLLRGQVICTSCGRAMYTQYSKRWVDRKPTSDRFYWCANPKTLRDGCDMPSVHAGELEAAVWETVMRLATTADITTLIRPATPDAQQGEAERRRAQLRREQERVQLQVQQLFDLLADGTIDRQQFAQQNRVYAERLAAIQAEGATIATTGARVADLDTIREAARRLPVATTIAERRSLLAAFGVRVEVTWKGLYLEVLGLRFRLPARMIGERWFIGPEYQRLDYQGTMLTDKQIRFLTRTYGKVKPEKLATKLGRSFAAIRKHAHRLRDKGVPIASTKRR